MSPSRLAFLTAALVCLAGLPARTSPGEPPAEPPDAIRRRVQQMSAAEKRELQEKQERFYRLPRPERQQLRDLHTSLSRSEQGARLRDVLKRYTRWLQTLSMYERAELLSLPPDERIGRIEQIMQRQAEHRLRSFLPDYLTDEDLKVLGEWLEHFFQQRREQIKQSFPWLESRLPADDDSPRRHAVMFVLMRMENWPEALRPTEDDVQGLKNRLSAKARKELETAQRAGKLQPLVLQWMRAVVFSRWRPMEVEDDELQRFYREELSGEQREYIDSLPPERMHYKLLHAYEAWKDGRLDDNRWLFDPYGDFRPGRGRPSGGPRPGSGFGGPRRPSPHDFRPPHRPGSPRGEGPRDGPREDDGADTPDLENGDLENGDPEAGGRPASGPRD